MPSLTTTTNITTTLLVTTPRGTRELLGKGEVEKTKGFEKRIEIKIVDGSEEVLWEMEMVKRWEEMDVRERGMCR
jgi:hypothetical protein